MPTMFTNAEDSWRLLGSGTRGIWGLSAKPPLLSLLQKIENPVSMLLPDARMFYAAGNCRPIQEIPASGQISPGSLSCRPSPERFFKGFPGVARPRCEIPPAPPADSRACGWSAAARLHLPSFLFASVSRQRGLKYYTILRIHPTKCRASQKWPAATKHLSCLGTAPARGGRMLFPSQCCGIKT